MPLYKHIDTLAPAPVEKLNFRRKGNIVRISWKAHRTNDEMQRAVYYCIYINDDTYPVAITQNTHYELVPEKIGNLIIRVSALDRMQNKSLEKTLTIR
ncbi:MAG TPA: hypothetical protein PK500_00005, partial [Candidatus Egerieousia sp.]|nr:hypothetical protein [Candidatus Egerieousia sp.]